MKATKILKRMTGQFRHIFMFIATVLWLFPVATVFVSIVKGSKQYSEMYFWSLPALREIPGNLISNLEYALTQTPILDSMLDTLLYAGVAAVGSAFIASLAGYALVHLDIRYPQAWFITLFSGNLLPFQMYLLPLYIGLINFGYYDTRLGLSLVYLALCVPFAVFLYRNYAHQVPSELIAAARIDGCGYLGIYRHIFLPITAPAFLSIIVVQFIWVWNNLLFGLVLSESVRPVMVAVDRLSPSKAYTSVPVILMGSFIAAVPAIVLFLVLHRYFVEGMSIRAYK